MARKNYRVIGGTAATKVINLSPQPAKAEAKRKKVEPVEVPAVEEPAVEEPAAEGQAPAYEPATDEV